MSKKAIYTRVLVILLVSLAAFTGAQAQEKKPKEEKKQADNSFTPYTPEQYEQAEAPAKKARKAKKKDKRGKNYTYDYFRQLDQKKEEFADRMKENVKKYRKMERQMKKPQYSDPMYFGHKNKPKKRPVGKRKLCKECGIVH